MYIYICIYIYIYGFTKQRQKKYVPHPDGHKEVKEGRGNLILISNKLLTRHPVLLTKIKAGNNSYINIRNQTNTISFVSA